MVTGRNRDCMNRHSVRDWCSTKNIEERKLVRHSRSQIASFVRDVRLSLDSILYFKNIQLIFPPTSPSVPWRWPGYSSLCVNYDCRSRSIRLRQRTLMILTEIDVICDLVIQIDDEIWDWEKFEFLETA